MKFTNSKLAAAAISLLAALTSSTAMADARDELFKVPRSAGNYPSKVYDQGSNAPIGQKAPVKVPDFFQLNYPLAFKAVAANGKFHADIDSNDRKTSYVAPILMLANAPDSVVDEETTEMMMYVMQRAYDAACAGIQDGRAGTADDVCRKSRRPQLAAAVEALLGTNFSAMFPGDKLISIFDSVGANAYREMMKSGQVSSGQRTLTIDQGFKKEVEAVFGAKEWSVMRVQMRQAMNTKKLFGIYIPLSQAMNEIKSCFIDNLYLRLNDECRLVNGRLHGDISGALEQVSLPRLAPPFSGAWGDAWGMSDIFKVYGGYGHVGSDGNPKFALDGDRVQNNIGIRTQTWRESTSELQGIGTVISNRLPAYLSLAQTEVKQMVDMHASYLVILVEIPTHSAGKKITGYRARDPKTNQTTTAVRAVLKGFAIADDAARPIEEIGFVSTEGSAYLPLVDPDKLAERFNGAPAVPMGQ